MARVRLNDTIRGKIALEIALNPKKSHLEISRFYGISRQLVTLIAKEKDIQRRLPRGCEGSRTYPSRPPADINGINMRFGEADDRVGRVIGNLIRI